jgi:hypothetical protein
MIVRFWVCDMIRVDCDKTFFGAMVYYCMRVANAAPAHSRDRQSQIKFVIL